MRTYHEPGRHVPVVEEADVFVAGGGPSGVVAAIAAARLGARTCLVDAAGCLGGMWTAGALGWIIDAANKPGILREIILELDRRGARYRPPAIKTIDIAAGAAGARDFAYDPEELKLVLEEMCARAGCACSYIPAWWTRPFDPQQRLTLALTESKSGRGGLGGQGVHRRHRRRRPGRAGGVRVRLGPRGLGADAAHEPGGLLATGLNLEEVARYVHNGPHRELNNRQLLLEEMQRAGVSSSYGKPTLWHLRENLYELAFNHEYGVSPLDARQITAATVRARAEMHRLVERAALAGRDLGRVADRRHRRADRRARGAAHPRPVHRHRGRHAARR